MIASNLLRVAALVDLPRSPQAGGHVKCWERLAAAAAHTNLPLDLTVYFSGSAPDEHLAPHVRLRHLPPVFSTARLKFLPYVPDHTDLSPYHFQLARELGNYDVIHTTDGFFAFAQTAERIHRTTGIPLTTSFHTDTPSYTRIFTRQTIDRWFHSLPWLRRRLNESWKIPDRQGDIMQRKLEQHVEQCSYALVTRPEDHILTETRLGAARVQHLRLGVDKEMFNPGRNDTARIRQAYEVAPGDLMALFVGRVDIGKNIHVLAKAMEKLINKGVALHLIVAGTGPAMDDVRRHLGEHASLPGFIDPQELARLYASVDLLALPSEVEIRSMAGVEAIASGCPVLVSQKSGITELFNHTSAMQPVDDGTYDWTQALAAFAADPQKRAAMRAAAIDFSQHHLASWQEVLAQDIFPIWRAAAGKTQRKAA